LPFNGLLGITIYIQEDNIFKTYYLNNQQTNSLTNQLIEAESHIWWVQGALFPAVKRVELEANISSQSRMVELITNPP
jgi:hypothetical protein